MRKRTCKDPSPSRGGRDCVGRSAEVQLCNQQACPGKF